MPSFVPPEILDEIVTRTDIVEIISSYVPLKKQGRNYVGLCPFHLEDTPSFSVSPEKQIYYCFGCQKGGNVLHFLMEEESLTLVEAGKQLAARCGVEIPQRPQTPAQAKAAQQRQALLRIHELAAAFYRKKLQSGAYPLAAAYLEKRGIDAQKAETFALGCAPEEDWGMLSRYLIEEGFSPELLELSGLCSKSPKNRRFYDKFHGRLIFPIADAQGHIIAFGGRILGEGQPKYLNSPQTPIYNKSRHLYGLRAAAPAIRREEAAVIVEGYMDVLACHMQGIEHAIAPLGTAFTPEQAALLKRYTSNVLLALDGDEAGIKATIRSIEILRAQHFNLKIMPFPAGMDPDDFLAAQGKEGWDAFAEEKALGPLEFLLGQAIKKHPGGTPAEKGRIVQELLPSLAKTPSQVERAGFITLLAQKLEVDEAMIYADLRKSGLKLPAVSRPRAAAPSIPRQLNGLEPRLLRLMLEGKAFYARLMEEVGGDFFRHPHSRRLLALLKTMAEKEHWHPAALLNDPAEEGQPPEEAAASQEEEKAEKQQDVEFKRFLLNILQIELPFDGTEEGKDHLLREYIKACHIYQVQEKVKECTSALSLPDCDERALLEEISRLQMQAQRLKSQSCS